MSFILDMTPASFALNFGLLFLAVIALIKSVNIAEQYERAVIFRLGKCVGTRGPGLFFMIPFIEWKTVIDTRVKTVSVSNQEAITKDNVPIKTSVAIWYSITDPVKSVVEVQDVIQSVVQIALTNLRSKIGEHNLDETLKTQAALAAELKASVDAVTGPWGVSVQQVQLSQVEIPASMQRAMAQEAEAIREKKSRLIKAGAENEAASLLREAAEKIAANPMALELRRMQMIQEVGAEQNTSTIIMFPSEFVSAAGAFAAAAGGMSQRPPAASQGAVDLSKGGAPAAANGSAAH